MSVYRIESEFRHTVNYSGLMIEICSDSEKLYKLDFLKDKRRLRVNTELPEPIIKTLSFLDDYFRGIKSNIEIVFISQYQKMMTIPGKAPDNKKNLYNLYLDMKNYSEKEVSVYRELLKVEPGETVSYSEIALRSGIPRGARFAGNCMAGNRFPVIIPCHRVIKKDGSIGNYTGGVEIKEFLLKLEKLSR